MHQTTVHKTIIMLFASTFMHQASVHTTFMSLCPQQNNARFMHQAAVHTTTNFADAKTQSLNIDAPNLGCINTKMFVCCQIKNIIYLCTKYWCIHLSWLCIQSKMLIHACTKASLHKAIMILLPQTKIMLYLWTKPWHSTIDWGLVHKSIMICWGLKALIVLSTQAWVINISGLCFGNKTMKVVCTQSWYINMLRCCFGSCMHQGLVHKYTMTLLWQQSHDILMRQSLGAHIYCDVALSSKSWKCSALRLRA